MISQKINHSFIYKIADDKNILGYKSNNIMAPYRQMRDNITIYEAQNDLAKESSGLQDSNSAPYSIANIMLHIYLTMLYNNYML